MIKTMRPFSPWQLAAAAGVEGLYTLAAMLLHLVESVSLLIAFHKASPPAYGTAAGTALISFLLLAPLRLGRWRWYLRLQDKPGEIPAFLQLLAGCRYWGAAVSWQWAVWWRQTGLLLVASLPTALLWGYGDRLTARQEPTKSLLWLVMGSLALLGAVTVTGLRRCRYALAPLLILRGCTAPLAVQLSLRLTRRRTGAWVNFWGDRAGWLLLCLLPGAAFWVLPRLRREYTALLTGWLEDIPLEATRRLA